MMKSKPVALERFLTVRASFIVDLVFRNNITILMGDSGIGKTSAFSFIREYLAANPKVTCFNYLLYRDELKEFIKKTEGKLILIDNADVLLNDDARKHIYLDDKNQYLIIGKNSRNLLVSREDLFELVSEKVGGQTKYTIQEYL